MKRTAKHALNCNGFLIKVWRVYDYPGFMGSFLKATVYDRRTSCNHTAAYPFHTLSEVLDVASGMYID